MKTQAEKHSSRARRLRALWEPGFNEDEYDMLWLYYRIVKQYHSFGNVLDTMAAYKRNHRTYAVQCRWEAFAPPNGSGYWLTATRRPRGWREREFE